MIKNVLLLFATLLLLLNTGCNLKKINSKDVLDTSTIKVIYKEPDSSMSCTLAGDIKETGFDLKSTKELAYDKAIKMNATHVYVYSVTTAHVNSATPDRVNNFVTSDEVYLIKAKAYKCPE